VGVPPSCCGSCYVGRMADDEKHREEDGEVQRHSASDAGWSKEQASYGRRLLRRGEVTISLGTSCVHKRGQEKAAL